MKYGSRKFIVTLVGMVFATALAYFDKMSGDTGIVLAAGIAAYNWANAKGYEST